MDILHERENSEETESFLKQNGAKFSKDCIRVLQLMYKGERLNGDTCKHLYGFSDRRLREVFHHRSDIVKKAWKTNEDGKRLFVEYWIDAPIHPTKREVVRRAATLIENLKSIGQQATLF